MQQACKNLKGINELYRQLKDYFDKFLISLRKFETDEDSRLHATSLQELERNKSLYGQLKDYFDQLLISLRQFQIDKSCSSQS